MSWFEAGVFFAGVALLAAGMRTGFLKSLADQLAEELENFRGGPPPPMHPSPVNDARLLRKRLRS